MCHSVLEEFAEKAILRRAQGTAMSVEVHCSAAADPEQQSSRSLFPCSARTSEVNSGQA